MVQITLQFLKLGLLLAMLAVAKGLQESDAILPEESYDLPLPKAGSYPTDGATDTAFPEVTAKDVMQTTSKIEPEGANGLNDVDAPQPKESRELPKARSYSMHAEDTALSEVTALSLFLCL